MPENGPLTAELERRFRTAAVDLEHRISTLETQMRLVSVVGGAVLTGLVTLVVLVAIGLLNP